MSLNGLDDQAVADAYQQALGEAGGWYCSTTPNAYTLAQLLTSCRFLLKYASRDSVALLTRGTGGATELRTQMHAYPDKEPLYAFLLYRRRKVLVRYVPDGTSRLLQARVHVHFTAIADYFTPHDTTLAISDPDDLSDSHLASACSLHTAAPSSSCSSLSSRKQKLDEITEDQEDGQSTADASESASTARPATATTIPAPEEPPEEPPRSPDTHHLLRAHTTPGPDSFKQYDQLFENGPDPRLSSQTARPDLADLYAEIYAQYNKPKVKLGPRPKPSLDIKRPQTSAHAAHEPPRAVSSLPPGLRPSNRKHTEPKRPKSRDAATLPSIAVPPPPPIPASPDLPLSPMYPPRSPASIRSLPMNTYSSLQHKSSGVTPEKQRLMKALELRKKQMEARKARDEDERRMRTVAAGARTESHCDEATSGHRNTADQDSKPAFPHEQTDAVTPNARTEPDDMHSASSPTSAQTHGSSVAPSTRPSSISEDDNPSSEDARDKAIPVPNVQTDTASTDDEKMSAQSTPTVVPDSVTSIPSVEISRQQDAVSAISPPEVPLEDAGDGKKSAESMKFKTSDELDEDRARRKSKRASMVLALSSESLQDARSKTLNLSSGQPVSDGKENHSLTIDPNHLSAENSEVDYLSDDSFMEELQSAKLEEAMPMSVSKSPIMPFFPRKTSSPEVVVPKRSASQQLPRLGGVSSEPSGPRKLSGPWLTHSNTDTAVVAAKKINVGSGISQRIKALAEKSNRDSTASLSPILTPDGASSIVAQRKSSFFSTPPDSDLVGGKSVNRLSRASFINVSRSTTPEPKPTIQPPPATTPKTHKTVCNVQQESEKPESVQVTARIVRDAKLQKPALTMPAESSPLELHQSPIIIDHQKSTRPTTSSSRHSPIKAEPASPGPPSSSQSHDPTSSLPRSSSESSWRSFGRRLSESKNGGPPRNMSTHSFDVSSGDEKPVKKEKKDSRTSKLFKRMSSISSITRKNSAPNITEAAPSIPLPSLREPPSAVQVGDLNIQFPDTLVGETPVGVYSSGS